MTLNQLWGINSPESAKSKFKELSHDLEAPKNLEEWILSQVGSELYELFVKGYTEKQWGRNSKELPASIIKRIPIRTHFNDFYFDDKYQGIPIGGYTGLVEKMLNGIEVKLDVDYIKHKEEFKGLARNIVFTGAIDAYFNYCFGDLDYRTTSFKHEVVQTKDYQGNALINYTDVNVPYTRIIEHKHFDWVCWHNRFHLGFLASRVDMKSMSLGRQTWTSMPASDNLPNHTSWLADSLPILVLSSAKMTPRSA